MVKNLPASCKRCRRHQFVLGLGRSPREGNDNPLHYSCLKKSMSRETWWATVQEVAESDTTQGLRTKNEFTSA